MQQLKTNLPTYIVYENAETINPEKQHIYYLVEHGKFAGYGLINANVEKNYSIITMLLKPLPDNDFIRSTLARQASLFPKNIVKY